MPNDNKMKAKKNAVKSIQAWAKGEMGEKVKKGMEEKGKLTDKDSERYLKSKTK